MTTVTALFNLLKAPVGALLIGAVAVVDLWHFHSLPQTLDIVILTGVCTAFGVNATYSAQASASTKAARLP